MIRSSPGIGSLIPGTGGSAGIAGTRGITGAWCGTWRAAAAGGDACGVADGTVLVGVSVVAGGLVSVVAGEGASGVGGAGCAVPALAGGAGEVDVVIAPGAGVIADLSRELKAIAAALPTSSTAIAVVMIATAGSRYQRVPAVLRSELGLAVCAGRAAAVSLEPTSDFGSLPVADARLRIVVGLRPGQWGHQTRGRRLECRG